MAEKPHVQTGPGRSEQSITIKLSEDALPVGLMPPTFPPDYVAGSVVPFFLAGSHVGETPSLPMIDLTLTKEEACPVQWWGMLYEGWVPNPDEEGTTVFLRGCENRGPNNERKKIYMTATTPDLIDTKYRGKIIRFYERLLADANAGKPMMQQYFDNYYDLYWDLHVGATGHEIPTEVRQFSAVFNTVLGFYYPTLEILRDAYMQACHMHEALKAWLDVRVQAIKDGKQPNADSTFVDYWLKNGGLGENFRRMDIVFECFHNFLAFSQWGNTVYNVAAKLEPTHGDPNVRAWSMPGLVVVLTWRLRSARKETQMATQTQVRTGQGQQPLPAPNSDFYELAETLNAEELAVVKQVRAFMEAKVAPVIKKYWAEDAFPFELLPALKELNIGGLGLEGYGCRGGSAKLFGFVAMELARVDASFCTFFGVHNGLAMGSIYLDGSEEQKQKWLPPMARMEKIGCFGLTEPLVGSGAGGGLTTTAKREGDTWILNGQKKWIGNSPWYDLSIIWARDVADNQVKGFIVESKTTPGFSVEKIENKIALRVVQNGLITLDNCRVPEVNRLQAGKSFRDTARVLRMTRYMVGWASTGCQMGAYEHALAYSQQRLQFGKPIGAFQMMQDLIAKMLGNVTACQCMMLRLVQMGDEGKLLDHHASLAKSFCTVRMRETVAWARELFGANGIVLDYNIARFFADAEALYSYEGTREMQNLIVGKAVTGFSAFV